MNGQNKRNTALMKVLVIIVTTILITINASSVSQSINDTKEADQHASGIRIFKVDFSTVKVPFIVCVWVLIASLAKIGFHQYKWLSSTIPESCLLIILGIPIGFIVEAANAASGAASGGGSVDDAGGLHLTSELFFFFLLPPIILDAGYFMTSDIFCQNIGTILLYAILGTIFNTFVVGASMYGVSGVCDVQITPLQSLVFGSLISAVDPVAVLAVFEEVQVNEILYMLVFGESVLNDAASVVLYRTFEHLSPNNINVNQIGLAIASFFVVSIGGTFIGITFALLASFITKFTNHVLVIEPVFVFLMSYLAYLTAEVFHFSGIMSILFCGLIMKPYVESNVSRKSHTTIKYFLKLLSSSCESIIFMFLGVSLVQFKHSFNFSFFMFTLLFITVFRAMGIVVLTGVANRFGRLSKVKKVEQFIMAYGGLRGAVAFCLAILLKPESCSSPSGTDQVQKCKLKAIVVTTTISVVVFTVFVQGCTIKKLVDVLGVKKSNKREKSMGETLNDRVLSYAVAGVEEILGVHSHGFWMNLLELFNRKYLRRWLEREPDLALDEELVCTQRRIAFKTALSYANKPQEIANREEDGLKLEEIKNSASAAMQLAIVAQQTPGYDGGFIDVGVLSASPHVGGEMLNFSHNSEAFNPRMISSLIPKAKPSLKRRVHNPSMRKYTLDSLEESDLHSRERHLKKQRTFQMEEHRQKHSRRSPHRLRRHKSAKSAADAFDANQENKEISSQEMTSQDVTVDEKSELLNDFHNAHSVDDVVADGGEKLLQKSSLHHKLTNDHKHHKHHHKHKHKHKTRKESEILPQVSDVEEPIRDVKCTYDFNNFKSEGYCDDNSVSQRDICIDIIDEMPSLNDGEVHDGSIEEQISVNDHLLEKEYVPVLPSYNESPSRQFSPYADTPLLDRSRTQLSGRDKETLLEAQKKHSTVESIMLSNISSHHINHQDGAGPPLIEEVEITNPWTSGSSPPQIVVDHHMDQQLSNVNA